MLIPEKAALLAMIDAGRAKPEGTSSPVELLNLPDRQTDRVPESFWQRLICHFPATYPLVRSTYSPDGQPRQTRNEVRRVASLRREMQHQWRYGVHRISSGPLTPVEKSQTERQRAMINLT